MNRSLNIKLSKGNFMIWRMQLLAYIRGEDAFGFLDGSSQLLAQIVPNTSTKANAPATMANLEYLAWCQRDQMILGVLISSLTEPYVVYAVRCATAHALWTTLVTMFASQAWACIMQIYFQLATVKKRNDSITKYFQTIKTLSETLAATGLPLNDFESVSFLLKGLGSEYDPFVTSVTTRVDPLSIDELYGHLLAHEMRIEQQLPSIDLAQPYANIISLLGLPCLEAEVTVAVAHHLPTVDNNTIMVVVLPPSTEGLAPNSPMTLPLHHGLRVKFVASWATLPSGAINGRIQHLHPNFSTIHKPITLPLPCLLKTTSTLIPGQLITLPMSSSIFQGPIKDQAKGHQLPFSVSTSSLCNPLDLIFSDVWGPSPTLSINGNRDYVSVIDTFSRFT
jgi:hypothetical protein